MLAGELLDEEIQTIIFGQTRRGIELILTYLRQRDSNSNPNRVRGYRSGYLAKERGRLKRGYGGEKSRAWWQRPPWNWALTSAGLTQPS